MAIGAEGDGNNYSDLDSTVIPEALWAVITARGKIPESTEENWKRAVTEWFPALLYKNLIQSYCRKQKSASNSLHISACLGPLGLTQACGDTILCHVFCIHKNR